MWEDGELFKLRHRDGRCIEVQYRFQPGVWRSTHTNNESQAVIYADKHLGKTIGIKSTRPVTFGEFAKDFFSPRDPHGWRKRKEKGNHYYPDSYYILRQGFLNNYIMPRWGNVLITAITDVAIDNWYLDLHSVRTGEELADDTKNKILLTLGVILQEAKRQRCINTNPVADVEAINAINKTRHPFVKEELRILFPSNREQLIHIWGSLAWACYFLILRDTGFRPGEAAALTKRCYYPKLSGIYTEQSIDNKTRQVKTSIKTTKKGQKYKIGLLSEQTMTLLDELIANTDDEYLFRLSPRGLFLCAEVSNKHLKAAARRAGVELGERTQYSFRHSFDTDIQGKVLDNVSLELMAHTVYHPEYDHRTPEQKLSQLQPVREILQERFL